MKKSVQQNKLPSKKITLLLTLSLFFLILLLVLQRKLTSFKQSIPPKTSVPQSENTTDERCYWDFRTVTPEGSPKKWTGWYNDMDVVPNKCKPITLSTGTEPKIPFKSEQECKNACVGEVYQSLETLENKYPVEHRPGDGRYYQASQKFTYEDVLYKLTIEVPTNYYLQVGNGREVFTQISNQTAFTDELPEGTGWFYLSVGDEFPPNTPQDALDNFVKSYLNSPNLTIINSTDTKIDGKSAKRVTIRPYEWDYPLTTFYFVKRNKIYLISCKYNQANQLNLCEQLIKTIKFTPE